MAANRSTFEKLQRDRAKKERKELKQAKRVAIKEGTGESESSEAVDVNAINEPIKPEKLMELVQKLTEDRQAGRIDQDEFEEQRIELMDRLQDD
jgi:hypothetical protein